MLVSAQQASTASATSCGCPSLGSGCAVCSHSYKSSGFAPARKGATRVRPPPPAGRGVGTRAACTCLHPRRRGAGAGSDHAEPARVPTVRRRPPAWQFSPPRRASTACRWCLHTAGSDARAPAAFPRRLNQGLQKLQGARGRPPAPRSEPQLQSSSAASGSGRRRAATAKAARLPEPTVPGQTQLTRTPLVAYAAAADLESWPSAPLVSPADRRACTGASPPLLPAFKPHRRRPPLRSPSTHSPSSVHAARSAVRRAPYRCCPPLPTKLWSEPMTTMDPRPAAVIAGSAACIAK